MEQHQKTLIDKNLTNLLENTKLGGLFLSVFIENDIFTQQDVDCVTSSCTPIDQVFEFYKTLKTRKNAYQILLQALKKTSQTGALAVLIGRESYLELKDEFMPLPIQPDWKSSSLKSIPASVDGSLQKEKSQSDDIILTSSHLASEIGKSTHNLTNNLHKSNSISNLVVSNQGVSSYANPFQTHFKFNFSWGSSSNQLQPLSQFSQLVVQCPNSLSVFGTFTNLDRNDERFYAIWKYIMNSSELAPHQRVVIHAIMEFAPGIVCFDRKSKAINRNKTLLFFKSTPHSIHFLAKWKNAFAKFYDRIAGAYVVNPSEMREPLRQIILVCSVELGITKLSEGKKDIKELKKMIKSCDSILNPGLFKPAPEDYQKINENTLVPYGNTVRNVIAIDGSPEQSQNFNEYMVYNRTQVEIQYAVDIEVFPFVL